ncbi:MAG: hypothetical protein OXD30_11400 [Bryobacterales bacterium]|nr:hypothetical protein [Bryobacterales bacterium]
MKCSFTGEPVPTDKLFLLYYPPNAAHETWEKSTFAAARAREALSEAHRCVNSFFWRYVATKRMLPGVAMCLGGLALYAVWALSALRDWDSMGAGARYLAPLAVQAVTYFGGRWVSAFLSRWKLWRRGCKEVVARELAAISRVMSDLPEDPDAEQAAAIMRREVPGTMSEVAFFRQNFKAFTYMDFVLGPKLRNPADRSDLPQAHSQYRDAYYVGEVVYDNARMFQQDRRTTVDPRFIGSGGRRGVI